MQDATVVRGTHGTRQLERVLERDVRRERTGPQAFAERLPFEQLGDDVRRALMGPDVVDSENPGVVEHAGGPGLLLEPPQAAGIGRVRRRKHLDRDVAAQPSIAGAVDLAHPAAADQRNDLVRADERTRGDQWQAGQPQPQETLRAQTFRIGRRQVRAARPAVRVVTHHDPPAGALIVRYYRCRSNSLQRRAKRAAPHRERSERPLPPSVSEAAPTASEASRPTEARSAEALAYPRSAEIK